MKKFKVTIDIFSREKEYILGEGSHNEIKETRIIEAETQTLARWYINDMYEYLEDRYQIYPSFEEITE